MDYPKGVVGVNLSNGKFADKANGVLGSMVPAAWGNLVTDELINFIIASGLVPSETVNNQVLQALYLLMTKLSVARTGSSMTGALALPSGTLAANALQLNAVGTGLYSPAANVLGLAANGIAALTLDTVGRMLLPNQPIASVFGAPTGNVNIGSYLPRIYASVNVNRGSWYNTANGRFTAQAAGVVMVMAGESTAGGVPSTRARKNGVWVGGSSLSGTANNSSCIVTAVQVAVGDYLDVCLFGEGLLLPASGNALTNSWAVFEFKG